MNLEQIINYIIANKEIIIVIALIGAVVTVLAEGAKKILSIIGTSILLIAVLMYFGVPYETIEDGISTTFDTTKSIFQIAKEKIPEYADIAGDLFDNAANSIKEEAGKLSSESSLEDTGIDTDIAATVHFIDVGQADCILVQDGNDVLLIDVGNRDDADLVVDYLQGLGIDNVDYFVATHPHEDHIGCAATILRTFNVDTVIKSTAGNTTVCYTKMMDEIEKQSIPVEIAASGNEYNLDNGSFQILGPVFESDDLNNSSVVLRYDIGEVSFLFTGDAEREEELDILEAGYDVQADVLKVGHHGSSTGTSYLWLREIMPEYAVIMCGENNEYGHPHEETLSRLKDADVQYYTTAESGTIVMETDGKTINVDVLK